MDLGHNADTANTQGYMPFPADPHGWQPPHPTTMPGNVRAAQIISWLYGALGIALSVLAGATGNYELCGALIGAFLPAFFLALFAFGYTVNGNGLRMTAIIFAAVGLLWVFSGIGGVVLIVPNIAIIILLSKRTAAAWFQRPH